MSRTFCFILTFTLTLPLFAGMPDERSAFPAVLMACCVAPVEQATARAGRIMHLFCVIGGMLALPVLADWMHHYVPMVGVGWGCTGSGRVAFGSVMGWLTSAVLCTAFYFPDGAPRSECRARRVGIAYAASVLGLFALFLFDIVPLFSGAFIWAIPAVIAIIWRIERPRQQTPQFGAIALALY